MRFRIFILAMILSSMACAHKKPVMEGCKKLQMADRDWFQCDKQVD